MAHQRRRNCLAQIKKQAKFWPVVGVQGLRQVGKTTLLRDVINPGQYVSLDDSDVLNSAKASGKAFLSQFNEPTVIDEIQKAPNLFDAIKSRVDKKRVPGQWYLTGSVAFSQKLGIRESLTGRIGNLHLYPLTLSELQQIAFEPKIAKVFHSIKPRISFELISKQMEAGGLPLPAFIRNSEVRREYWQNWVDTAILRDVPKAFGKNYDPEICKSILEQFGLAAEKCIYPALEHLNILSRRAKNYIRALEDVFILRRFTCHHLGTGRDIWIFGDSGLASYFMKTTKSHLAKSFLVKQFVLNEILAANEYVGKPLPKHYFKSMKGTIIDLVWDNIPIKIVGEEVIPTKLGWLERPLLGAMKHLNSSRGIIVAPISQVYIPKKGIAVVPWTYWS